MMIKIMLQLKREMEMNQSDGNETIATRNSDIIIAIFN